MKYLLGVDFGGSSSKATLLREDGVVAATASREYPTYYPENGWAEQDAEDSYNAACANIRALLEKTGIAPEDVAALARQTADKLDAMNDADFEARQFHFTDE